MQDNTEKGKQILANCDLSIIWDITEIEGSTEESPKTKSVCYIGWPQDLDAGMWGGPVSDDNFDTIEDALNWAVKHEKLLLEQVEDF